MSEIIIKKGSTVITSPKKNLIDVSETADGVAFNFKGGLQIVYTDQFMPSANKQIIKNTMDRMHGKMIKIDLDNTMHPAILEV